MTQFELKKSTAVRPWDKHWQFCAGSGHAGLALRADYTRQLAEAAKDLGIRRVRFHGIFCEDMHTVHAFEDVMALPVKSGITEKSFRLCGVAYDNVLAAGMKPFVELSFMPNSMAKEDVHGMFYYKPNICMPKDDAEWTEYITHFIEFLLDRYGAEEVEQWYFEVWNEPDLVIPFFHGTQEDYFHLYEITVRAIKAADPRLRVGGPATSGSKWVASFVKYMKEHDVPVDFVSTHQYAGDPLGGVKDQGGPDAQDGSAEIDEGYREQMAQRMGTVLQQAPRDAILPAFRMFMGDPLEQEGIPDDVFIQNAPVVKQQAAGLPVFYTEWNTCATFGAYTNDTRKVAAYDVKTALALDGVIDGSSIWCFSDIFEELHPFPEEFHGGFGLMTQSGIKKPVYYALEMLHHAGEQRYELPLALDGEISQAAFESGSETQILLTRSRLQNRFDLPKEKVAISVELDAAPVKLILERIDEDHCNPLARWEEMGSPQVPDPREVREIEEASTLLDEALPFTYEDGVLRTEVALGVNDVYFIRIVK